MALTAELNDIGRSPKGEPIFPRDDDMVRALVLAAAGLCGAAVGAAVKREKRLMVVLEMWKARSEGMDITPAVAQRVAQRLLRRGLDARACPCFRHP